MWNETEVRQAYNAYGVDLIRTAGLLLRTTPSAIFRASVLFQRFQRHINTHFRSRYLSPKETKEVIQKSRVQPLAEGGLYTSLAEYCGGDNTDPATAAKVEYLIPDHVGQDMVSGLAPLADLFAPLDYCVSHIIDHEDIGFLAASCLLVAVKMEDTGIRIRHVVNVFMRLSQRRCGIGSMIYLKPPPERYEDFKACIVESEEILLQQLGFQTFVECPHKYVVLFLHILIEDRATAEDQKASPSPAFVDWLAKAISWVNDAPRCEVLAQFPAMELAVFAIRWSCPGELKLPIDWNIALGVSHDALERIRLAYDGYLAHVEISSREELDAIRAAMPKAEYRTRREKALAEQREPVLTRTVCQVNEEAKTEITADSSLANDYDEKNSKFDKNVRPHTSLVFNVPSHLTCLDDSATRLSSTAELLDAIGLSCPESYPCAQDLKHQSSHVSPKRCEDEKSVASSPSVSSDEDEFEYEDLKQVQKRRRQEEAEEMHRKNTERSQERYRKKHRSPNHHQERQQGRRHHRQSRRSERYNDDRKGRDRQRHDRDTSQSGDKPIKGIRRYDSKCEHGKRSDGRHRRH